MNKHLTLLAAALLLVCCCFEGSAQKLATNNRRQLLDYNWKFSLGDQPEASEKVFDDKNWRALDLPHDWSIEGKLDPKHPMGNDGGYFPAGIGWYRKTFKAPSAWKGKQVSVYFEGVYMNSEVFINGKSLGVRPYGYSSFFYDLTPYLQYGKENVIAVRVDNAQQKNSRWYSGSGIYRHVWLTVTNPVHIGQWGVAISTPGVSREKATVQVKTLVKNDKKSSQRIVVSTQLTDKSGKSAGKGDAEVTVPANGEKEVVQSIIVEKPGLWSPETPVLYEAQVKLVKGRSTLDEVNNSFGIRSIAFSTEKGFQLNGETVILNGGCVHHDNGILGAAAYDRAEYKKVELLKAAGFNAVRTAHNPPSEAFLDACDRLGLIVMDESFDGWRESKTPHDYAKHFDKWWQQDIEAMVLRDRNHPSIVFWSTGNEIIERKKPEAVETATMLASHVRKLDPTRPVTSAMTTWDNDWEIFDPLFAAHDIGGYNYQLHRAASDHARVPARIIVQTESYPRDAFANWKLVQEHPYIIGDFVWTAMDYLGESSIGRYYYTGEKAGQHWEGDFFPWHGAYCGDIDLIGWRKPISHYRDLLYNEDKKLYMAVKEPSGYFGEIKETMWSVWPTWESWNWPGHEGKEIQVEVYSRHPKVRLYLNDKLIGEKQTAKEQEFKAVFTLPYAAGTLKAVGVAGDKEVESRKLKTAGKASRIKLVADRTELQADGQDLAYVMVEVTDAEGNIEPNAENLLQFNVTGEGVIAAVGNANLKDADSYAGNERKAWKGRAMVILKSTQNAGEIRLEVSSPGLERETVIIRTGKSKSPTGLSYK
ncbi:sugar-binding domain-containing protein [Botryobacter ruber]|uniref:sugar-binding domain-containing protein n=1 Tax=Botryobacter ruber TaxID=2171629 RepID=UPI000E0C24AD|nr:sugar-binding domain-containing protein [Botryobacter ruber]